MKRLYYLTDDIVSTEKISEHVHNAGVTDWHFHVVSKDEAGLYQHHVHGANLFQKTDIVHLAERGGLYGIAIGVLLVFIFSAFEVFEPNLSNLGALATLAFSTLLGTWFGGFVGIQKENYKLTQFHDDIEWGRYLIMIDVDVGEEDTIRMVMAERHPEAYMAGEDTSLISPFDMATRTQVH